MHEDGEEVFFADIHHGALLNGDEPFVDKKFVNRHLKIEKSAKRLQTKSTKNPHKEIQCANSKPKSDDCTYYFVNGAGAEAGDGFCCIELIDGSLIHEVHQAKFYTKNDINFEMFKVEKQKAADVNDFFLLYTTTKYTGKPLEFSGVVDEKVWESYFGPFAGRAFRCLRFPNANESCFTDLTGVNGIGEIRAKLIIKNRPYGNIDDCAKKTQIPSTLLRGLSFGDGSSLVVSSLGSALGIDEEDDEEM
ncbi:hypothetical protein HK096_000931 [Nowakowskiella sp. JEL0078]|nr:hypothetical protein HK096_000931 [Nowakowskiella sp. JEL0078]